MTTAQNAYTQYQNSKVLTASPGELILRLYDGVIRFCNIAKEAIDKGDMEIANTNLIKAQRIIDHLMATLDRTYEVAVEFDNIYQYLLDALMIVNIDKDAELLDAVIVNLRLVRSNWIDVMAAAKMEHH